MQSAIVGKKPCQTVNKHLELAHPWDVLFSFSVTHGTTNPSYTELCADKCCAWHSKTILIKHMHTKLGGLPGRSLWKGPQPRKGCPQTTDGCPQPRKGCPQTTDGCPQSENTRGG